MVSAALKRAAHRIPRDSEPLGNRPPRQALTQRQLPDLSPVTHSNHSSSLKEWPTFQPLKLV